MEKFIQKMHLKEGALTAVAAKHHGIKQKGGIKSTFLEEAAAGKYGKKNRTRANLAKTFKKMHH